MGKKAVRGAGSGSCWSASGNGSGGEVVLEADTEPLAPEGGVVVVTLEGAVTGANEEPTAAAGGGAHANPAPVLALVAIVHQMWEASKVRAYNEVLGGELQPEVELLQGVEAKWAGEPGSGEEEELVVEDGQGAGHQ